MLLVALWIVAVAGCSLLQVRMPTVSSSPPSGTPSPAAVSPQRFDGVTIHIITHDGAQQTVTRRHIAGFENLTGAKVKQTGVPFKDLYDTLQRDWSSGASQYEMAIALPQWQIDFIQAGYLEDLTDRRKADVALQWDDIAPLWREFSAVYKGHTYSIPLDGDFHMLYYRTDLLKQAGLTPPATWDDYLAIAKQFHDKDLNGDGKPDYGSCIEKRPKEFSASILGSFIAPFLQSQGTAQGIFFDPDTMKPLVNNPGFARALEIYKQTTNYGVPDDKNLSQPEARRLFLSGRCAMTLDWGDVGTQSIYPTTSNVMNKVGTSITPGSTQVLDRQANQLIACNKFTCPYAINGVNHAPYAAYGGWVGVVAAKAAPRVKDAAYAFLSYMGQPAQSNVDVTVGATGYNPYRVSQFKEVEPWLKAGMSLEMANNYLGTIEVSLSSPNIVLDLTIPHNQQYLLNVLDAVRADFLRNKLTQEEAMQQIEQRWQQITDRVGRADQKAAYRSSLGLPS
jgi:multiple sugar transport system substrate-binding protein